MTEVNPRWKQGLPPKKLRTPLKRTALKVKRDPALEAWSKQVRERDGYACQFAGSGYVGRGVDAHHLASKTQHPELKYVVSNGLSLCGRFTENHHHGWVHDNPTEATKLGLKIRTRYENRDDEP